MVTDTDLPDWAPCVCGHTKNEHNQGEDCTVIEYPVHRGIKGIGFFCQCLKFKLDNLTYIKQLREEHS